MYLYTFNVNSRDSLMHFEEKEVLLNKLYGALRPGGKLVMTDYCLGEKVRNIITLIFQQLNYNTHIQ